MHEITSIVAKTNVSEWSEEEQESKYEYLYSFLDSDNSLMRVIQMYTIMMGTHKPDVTWLDEIAEALKNCAQGLSSYLTMSN